jgi:diaminopimelate epimerase
MTITVLPFAKGHGAGNDFVVIPDLDNRWDLTPDAVRALCDRRQGIGGDGIVRLVRRSGDFFMDYRNADGSLAETCGNGLRVAARYLVEAGLVPRGRFQVQTRGGAVTITVAPDDAEFRDIAVRMGVAVGEREPTTHVVTEAGHFTGTPMYLPNPHCVSIVGNLGDVGNLRQEPDVDPISTFPDGANFEFIERRGSAHIGMRTFERGVGETLACGSGACAAAQVWAHREMLPPEWTVRVDVLGGTLHVDSDLDGMLTLRGPAVFVARGEALVDI